MKGEGLSLTITQKKRATSRSFLYQRDGNDAYGENEAADCANRNLANVDSLLRLSDEWSHFRFGGVFCKVACQQGRLEKFATFAPLMRLGGEAPVRPHPVGSGLSNCGFLFGGWVSIPYIKEF